jgi:hypothetical protein
VALQIVLTDLVKPQEDWKKRNRLGTVVRVKSIATITRVRTEAAQEGVIMIELDCLRESAL